MATAAQIEANRRNAKLSTGPRTEAGKNRSRFNALDHGCRAHILALPTEEFGAYEDDCRAWKLCFKPRNSVEEYLIEGILSLKHLTRRIEQAEAARLTTRMHYGVFDEEARQEEQVIELGQKLFRDASGPQVLHLEDKATERQPGPDGEIRRVSDYAASPEEHPTRLARKLRASGPGCEWMLERWQHLRELLEQGKPWLAPDKLKAVRLLGRHPVDALDYEEVARIYLASHVLLHTGGDPFQEILNELSPEEAARFAHYLDMRGYRMLTPKDPAAARRMLLEIVDRATAVLEDSAGVFRELEKINLEFAGHRLSWDDTPEGERLRRYELTCKRASSRMFDLLFKVRRTGAELDIATIASLSRSVPTVTAHTIDQPEFFDADDMIASDEPREEPPPSMDEPGPPIEANPAHENAPNEPNLHDYSITIDRQDGHKGFRIDTPHLATKPGGIGRNGKAKGDPVLDRVLGGQKSTLMNLSPIFGAERPS